MLPLHLSHRCTAALLYCCMSDIHMFTLCQLYQFSHRHTTIILHRYNNTPTYIKWLLIYTLILRSICHHCISSIHALPPSMPVASILSPTYCCITDCYMAGIYVLPLCQLYQFSHYCIAVLLYHYITAPI